MSSDCWWKYCFNLLKSCPNNTTLNMSAKTILILCVLALFSVGFSMPTEKVETPKEDMKTAESIYSWSPYIRFNALPTYPIYGYRSALPYYSGLNYDNIYSDWAFKK